MSTLLFFWQRKKIFFFSNFILFIKKSLLLIVVIIKKFLFFDLSSLKKFKKSLGLVKFSILNDRFSLISSKILYNIGTSTMLIFCLII